ncbi:MAG: hypothetical protein ACK56F_24445 [bacterium]
MGHIIRVRGQRPSGNVTEKLSVLPSAVARYVMPTGEPRTERNA